MSGDLYAPRRGNRGLWAAVGACAVLNVVTLSLLVLAFTGRSPLSPFEGAVEDRHGRSLLTVIDFDQQQLFIPIPSFPL